MAKGPERRAIDAVHRKLSPLIHKQGMTGGMGANGIPDYYYDYKRDLWIEWKSGRQQGNDLFFTITPLQRQWCMRRSAAGGNCYIVVSTSTGYNYVLPDSNIVELSSSGHRCYAPAISPKLLSAKEVAGWIAGFCGA